MWLKRKIDNEIRTISTGHRFICDWDNIIDRDLNLYSVAHIIIENDGYIYKGPPLLFKNYSIMDREFIHHAWLDSEVYSEIKENVLLRKLLSDSLEGLVDTLLLWDLSPRFAIASVHYVYDEDVRNSKYLEMTIHLVKKRSFDWIGFWNHLEKNVYQRVDSRRITINVERVLHGPKEFLRIC